MKKIGLRTAIVLLWVAIIFCILYWPKWRIFSFGSQTLTIFAWGDILDPAVVKDFEKETGIQIHLNYYSSNEELIVKLRATRGEGYDLIIPSDYAVDILIREDLLKPLKKEKFDFWHAIHPGLLNHFFDPNNLYSIPMEWEVYGFGIDKEYFQTHPMIPSWKMIFDPQVVDYKITMNNDPIEATEFAAFYLYGPTSTLDPTQTEQVRNLLVQQRPWVTAYANFRGDYFLATHNCSVVVSSSSYIWRSKRLFDFIGFVLPEEGTFITIENLCIPKPSEKEELVYRFINYLFRPESVASHFHTFGFFPSATHAQHLMKLDPQATELLQTTPENFKKFHFIKNLIPQEKVRDIWVDVKTS